MMPVIVDLRCPLDRRRLFGKLKVEKPVTVTSGNLLEFACAVCRKRTGAVQVWHRFDMGGHHIETEVVEYG